MATEFPGNAIPAPGFYGNNPYTVDDEIMYSMAGYTQKGVTLKPGQGVLVAGTVLGRITASKLWVAYSNAAGDGSSTARGILRKTVDTGTDPNGKAFQANIVITGIVKNSKVSGADSGAITSLKARQDTILDAFFF